MNKRIWSMALAAVLFLTTVGGVTTAAAEEDPAENKTYTTTWVEGSEPETITGVQLADYPTYESDQARLEAMTLVTENEKAALYVNKGEAQFAVLDKGTGNVQFSTPTNIVKDELIRTDDVRQDVLSLFNIEYYNRHTGAFTTAMVYKESVQTNQYTYATIPNGFRFVFTIGRDQKNRILPKVIFADSLENDVIAKTDEAGAKSLNKYYKKYDFETMSSLQKEAILEQYPAVEQAPIYVLKNVTEKEKATLEEIFIAAGYTQEMLEAEYEKQGLDMAEEAFPFFEIPMEVVLDGEDLKVIFKTEYIRSNTDDFILTKIHALKFMVASKNDEEGYLFYPDGSGAIVDTQYTNTKQATMMTGRVYGGDYGHYDDKFNGFKEQISLPVFGVKKATRGMLGILETGAERSNLSLSFANSLTSYTNVYPTLIMTAYGYFEYTDVMKVVAWNTFEKGTYADDYVLRYRFVNDPAKANYSGLAILYRDYLLETGGLKKSEVGNTTPLYMEMLGSTTVKDRVLGMPVDKKVALTDYASAQEILLSMNEKGVNAQMIYNGWANGGLMNAVFNDVKPESILGGKKGLEELLATAKDKDVPVWLKADMLLAKVDRSFDGFDSWQDSSRNLSDKIALKPELSLSMGLYSGNQGMIVLSPTFVQKTFEKFLPKFEELNSPWISLPDMGTYLNSDFNTKNPVNRMQSLEINRKILEQAANGRKLMVEGANSYVLPYADLLTNIPESSSGYSDASQSVPFLQMVLHGSVSYSSKALNLSGDYESALLKAVENGSGLYFTLAEENYTRLKNTYFSYYYSVGYDFWYETMMADYARVSKVLDPVSEAKMVSHQLLEGQVAEVVYDNGKTVYVNYSDEEVTVGEQKLAARDFMLVG